MLNFREEGEIGSKSREEGSESRKKGDLLPCSTPLSKISGGSILLKFEF